MAKNKKCPVMLRNKPGQLCEEECPLHSNEACEIVPPKDGWAKLAEHKWPLEQYAERQAVRCAGYLSNNVLDGLSLEEKELTKIEIKLYILRALKYGQRHPSSR